MPPSPSTVRDGIRGDLTRQVVAMCSMNFTYPRVSLAALGQCVAGSIRFLYLLTGLTEMHAETQFAPSMLRAGAATCNRGCDR